MNIKEVEKITGLSKSNIRYYEDQQLISPKRDEKNNYRVYSQEEIDTLMNIKKLRLLGIKVDSIRKYLGHEESLHDLLECRLKEIDSDNEVLQKQANICRQSLQKNVTDVKEILFDESAETWQRRLAILMRDDIVEHKLTRMEFNRDVLVLYFLGCVTSILTDLAMMLFVKESFLGEHVIAFAVFAGILITGLAPVWSRNLKVHICSLVLSSIFTAIAIFGILAEGLTGQIQDYDVVPLEAVMIGKILLGFYLGLAVLSLLAWTLSQLCPKVFCSFLTALILSVLYVVYTYSIAGLISGGSLPGLETVELIVISLLYALILTVKWTMINKEKFSFTRYHATVTAVTMTNIVFTVISGSGNYGSTNFRR